MLKIKNDASLKLLSECAFKVKRTRTKVASAESLHYQWFPHVHTLVLHYLLFSMTTAFISYPKSRKPS